TPIEILRAALESVALRFGQIYELLEAGVGQPKEVIASGGALLSSPAWTQMMADVLGRPVTGCVEGQASARGAALWVAERIGALPRLEGAPTRMGATYAPDAGHRERYREMLAKQEELIGKLFEKHG